MVTAVIEAGRFYAYALIQLLIEPGLFSGSLWKNKAPPGSGIYGDLLPVLHPGRFTDRGLFPAGPNHGAHPFPERGRHDPDFIDPGIYGHGDDRRKKARFAVVFSIYAFSSGVTLFLSWLPFLVWVTEPWKWWLISTGLKNTCSLSWKRSIVIVALSTIVLFFWCIQHIWHLLRIKYLSRRTFNDRTDKSIDGGR